MTDTFRVSANLKDRALVCFSADDNAALLRAICSNTATGYVRQMRTDGPVSVPRHAAERIEQHLTAAGWAKA